MDDDKPPNSLPGQVTGGVIRTQSIAVVNGSGQDSLPEGKRAWSFLFFLAFCYMVVLLSVVVLPHSIVFPHVLAQRSRL